jgi:hypothetical protein
MANTKLPLLPKRVAFPSFVIRIPAFQAARSSA